MANPQEKKRGNPGWQPGVSGNTAGRPKTIDRDKKTNRTLRQEEYLSLVRKFKPHLAKAIRAATNILDDPDASEAGKLRSSALILQTYKDLIRELYLTAYDDEEAEEIQENNKPVFSLRIIGEEKEEDKTK